jgi:putative hemolysin
MAENILRLESLTVESAMTPLEQVTMLPADAARDEMLEVMRLHRYSRIPVYGEDRRHIVGVVNVIDVVTGRADACVADLRRDVLSIPGDESVAEALRQLRDAREQIAIAVDADERALGLLTIKDLVEEIVGELDAW